MNVLEPLLKQSSPSVTLSISKIFLQFCDRNPDLKSQVAFRLKAPLLTLIATNSQELGYTVLLHIHLLLTRALDVAAGEQADPRVRVPSWMQDYIRVR